MTIRNFICKKARTLLLPYIVFGLCHYIVSVLLYGFSMKPLIHLFTINTDGIPIAGALWFLTALFFTDFIYFLLDKYEKIWLIPLFVLVGSFADQVLPYALPWALSAAFVGLGLYWFGYMTKRFEEKLHFVLNMPIWCCIIVGAITTFLIFLNGYVNMREGKYAWIPLFWVNVLLAIFVGISISKLIDRWLRNCKLKVWLLGVGKNSIVYLCLNQIVILCVTKIFGVIQLPGYINKILILAISLCILFVASIILTKTKLKILLGR